MIIQKELSKFDIAVRENVIRIELVTKDEEYNVYLDSIDIESCKQIVNGLGMAIKSAEKWELDQCQKLAAG